MTTIYVLTSGSYSDYTIIAVFSTKELATRLIELGHGDDIEEYELDAFGDEWLAKHITRWRVTMELDTADVTDVFPYQLVEQDSPDNHYSHIEKYGYMDKGRFITYVRADTQERAVKVAMERRSVWLANQAEEVSE